MRPILHQHLDEGIDAGTPVLHRTHEPLRTDRLLGHEGRQAALRTAAVCGLVKEPVEIRRRLPGNEHPEALVSTNNLAEVLRAEGNEDGARTSHEQVLEARCRVHGEEHRDTLQPMNNLAVQHHLEQLDQQRGEESDCG